jgi:hypothetical protein
MLVQAMSSTDEVNEDGNENPEYQPINWTLYWMYDDDAYDDLRLCPICEDCYMNANQDMCNHCDYQHQIDRD